MAFTWYQHLTSEISYSLVMTVLFSLTAVKAMALIVDYKKFQSWVDSMLKKEKGKNIVLIDIGVGVFGLLVVVLAFYVY